MTNTTETPDDETKFGIEWINADSNLSIRIDPFRVEAVAVARDRTGGTTATRITLFSGLNIAVTADYDTVVAALSARKQLPRV